MIWLLFAGALLPTLAVSLWFALTGALPDRLAAVPMASTFGALLLVALSFAFNQTFVTDLGVCLALLSLPATLILALCTERWL